MIEQSIKNEILQFIKYRKDIILYPIKNTGTARMDKRTGRMYYTRGMVMRGVADFLGMLIPSGRFIAVEVKTTQGLKRFIRERVKPYTTEFYENEWGHGVENCGGIYLVVDSVEMLEKNLSHSEEKK